MPNGYKGKDYLLNGFSAANFPDRVNSESVHVYFDPSVSILEIRRFARGVAEVDVCEICTNDGNDFQYITFNVKPVGKDEFLKRAKANDKIKGVAAFDVKTTTGHILLQRPGFTCPGFDVEETGGFPQVYGASGPRVAVAR